VTDHQSTATQLIHSLLPGDELAPKRRALEGLLRWAEASPLAEAVLVWGSVSRGAADAYSDIDVNLVAAPGRWVELWEQRSAVTAAAGCPVMVMEHQWEPVETEASCAAILEDGLYLDLAIQRAGAPAKEGQVVLWQRAGALAAPEPGEEPAPLIQADPISDRFHLFWFGSLLCAQWLARGDLWAALEFVTTRRSLILGLWRRVHGDKPHYESWKGVGAELPVAVRSGLATAVPEFDRRKIAEALWSSIAVLNDIGPGLADAAGTAYPAQGARKIQRLIAQLFAAHHLPVPAWAEAGESAPQAPPEPGPADQVTLREITHETLRKFTSLTVAPDQRHVVAPNAISVAEAYFEREHAWFRGIYAGEAPVGFVMLWDDPQKQEYFLWRFMIDARYQGRGYGKRALELVIDHVRTRPGAEHLGVSYHKGPGAPDGFYRSFGFVETGETYDEEYVAKLKL